MTLTRTDLEAGRMRAIFEDAKREVLSEADLDQSVAVILDTHPAVDDLWIYGYGSLIWNPLLHYVEQCPARVHGLHRSFCLWSHASRGTVTNPGLVLGLDRGGSCHGMAFRIAAADAPRELKLLWRREMVVASYHPRWIEAQTKRGPLRAIAFVVNRRHPHYVGKLPEDRIVDTLATARGAFGSSADYLRRTLEALRAHGIEDARLASLALRVSAYREELQNVNPVVQA